MSTSDPQRTVCPVCGRVESPGADFCECGEYLGWDDPEAATADDAPATPATPPDAAPAPREEPTAATGARDAASIDLRLPHAEHHPGAAIRLRVAPGDTAAATERAPFSLALVALLVILVITG